MKKNLLFNLGLLLCLISSTAFAQHPVQEWAKYYDSQGSTGGTTSYNVRLVADAEGNSYVSATVSNYNTSKNNIVTIKYSPSGEELWKQINDGGIDDGTTPVAIDNSGGVYVASSSGNEDAYDIIVIRYDAATGEQTWIQRYDGGNDTSDEVSAITVDNSGGVYIAGFSGNDFITIRYDATTGDQDWVSRYSGPSDIFSKAKAITVNNEGGVYVTGSSFSKETSSTGFITIGYDAATGKQIWIQRYNSSDANYSEATALVIDDQNNIYVTGRSNRTESLSNDFTTISYDADTGEQRWITHYNGPGNSSDLAFAIAIDNQESVYVTGYSYFNQTKTSVYTTVSYSTETGQERWVQQFGGGNSDQSQARAIVADNYGGIYVTGFSNGDFATVRYNASTGEETWVSRHEDENQNAGGGSAIALNNQGDVYVTGQSGGFFAILSYLAESGEENWVNQYSEIGSLRDEALSVAIDNAGNSYVTGTATNDNSAGTVSIVTIKYAPSGEEVWVQVHDEEYAAWAEDITVDHNGGVYVTGYLATGAYITIRYDAASGKESWVSRFEGGTFVAGARNIAVDNQGGIYVTGSGYGATTSSAGFVIIRYDAATGKESWVSRFDGGSYYSDAYPITVDNQGSVYVTGNSNGDFITIRYDAQTGEQLWLSRYDTGTGYNRVAAITVDNNGGVYVTGRSDEGETYYSDIATVRYDAATGKESWVTRYGSPGRFEEGVGIASDDAGGIYVIGSSASGDDVTIKYDAATGKETWHQNYEGGIRSITLDKEGGVYVAGARNISTDKGIIYLFNTTKYSAADGKLLWDIHSDEPESIALDLALDAEENVIVTGFSTGENTGRDFLTIKYSQQQEIECLTLGRQSISGASPVAAGTTTTYSLHNTGASSFEWHITASDGTAVTSFSGQGTSSLKVKWPSPDVYKISVSYASSGDCPSITTTKYVHVHDTEAGFITGGGWSSSPAKQQYELMKQSDKAHWAFSAKYKKKDQVQGSFQLKVGDYVFQSTSIKNGSLAIVGEKAYFRGKGKLSRRNHAGKLTTDPRSFGFLISATDAQAHEAGKGQAKKANSKDRLRVLIWRIEDGKKGKVVYDGQLACGGSNTDYNSPACQAIGGGNIIIHRRGLKEDKKHELLTEESPQQLEAYPTAFTDHTTIRFTLERETAYTLELYDLKGALVKQIAAGTSMAGQYNEHKVQGDGLQTGLYLVRLTTGTEVQTVKVVVQK